MIRTRILVVLGFLLTLSIPVTAQWKDNMGGSWNNPTSASIGNIINDQLWNRMRAKARARDQGKSVPATTRAAETPAVAPEVTKKTPAQIDAAVRFRSTGTQLRTQAFADFLSAGGTPETKKRMTAIISMLLTEYEKAAKEQGKPNDLALATTAALVYNSSIYHGTADPDDASIMEIRGALAELEAEDGTFASMTDRQKQELYENLVISTMLAKAGYEEAQKGGDKANMAIYRDLAGQTLQAVSGMAPEKIRFMPDAPTMEALRTDSTTTNGTDPSSPPTSPQTVPQDAPPAAIGAGSLVMEFEGNEVRANQMYGGKRIRVNGTVNSIDIQKNGQIILTFHSPFGGYAQTQCYFNKSQSSRLAEFSGGQQAVVEGTVKGIGGGMGGKGFVVLENCTVP